MLDDLIEVEESEIPKNLGDDKMIELARTLGQLQEYYQESRQTLENIIWPACDRAFMCIRDEMTCIPSMKFIDNGMLGESDLRDALKSRRNEILSGLIPSDESWLEPVSLEDEDDETALQKTKSLLIDMVNTSRYSQAVKAFVDQLLIRGTSALGMRWERVRAVRRLPKRLLKDAKLIQDGSQETDDGEGNPIQLGPKATYWRNVYNGPRAYPIDMYRLFIDPDSELGLDSDPATFYMMFKSAAELKGTKLKNGKHAYDQDALKDIREWTYAEYYNQRPFACESTKLMGLNPMVEETQKFIPVYLFHKTILTTDDGADVYVDKFFYLAQSSADGQWRIIRVHDNPSDFGDKPFYIARYDEWLNLPYGTGLAEKSLSAWKGKNLLAAVGLNVHVLTAFPPYSYATNVIKDDNKPKWMPGHGQQIVMRAGVGLDWIKPFPIEPNNAMFDMQAQRYQSEKILAQTATTQVSQTSNPTKSMSSRRTAQEIKQEATEGAVSSDQDVSMIQADVIQPSIQSMYNLCRQNYDSDTAFMSTSPDGKPIVDRITVEELNRDRTIKIVGRRGLANKANEISNLMDALKILANPGASQVIANLSIILQDVLFKLLGRFGVEMKDEYRVPPEMLAARTPQAQQAALQGALQDPSKRQEIGQMLLNSPEGRQFVEQLEKSIKDQTLNDKAAHEAQVKDEASAQNKQKEQQQQMQQQSIGDHIQQMLGGEPNAAA